MPLSMTCITHYVLVMPLTRARVRPRALVLTARWVVAGVARHGLGHCEDLFKARRRPEVDEPVQARADHHVRARDGVGPHQTPVPILSHLLRSIGRLSVPCQTPVLARETASISPFRRGATTFSR